MADFKKIQDDFNEELYNPNRGRQIKKLELDQCLKRFIKPEELDSENKVYCDQCQAAKEATKTIEICKLPNYLIMHLKRFKYT